MKIILIVFLLLLALVALRIYRRSDGRNGLIKNLIEKISQKNDLFSEELEQMVKEFSAIEKENQIIQDQKQLSGGSTTKVKVEHYGEGNFEYWLFKPETITNHKPVVIFNHGWAAMSPKPYQAWLEHIASQGYMVIYPKYQESLRTSPKTFTNNVITVLDDAFGKIKNQADLSSMIIVGHSMGGVISANLAALASTYGLPKPLAVMPIEPGKTWGKVERTNIAFENLSDIPADTKLWVVVGSEDRLVSDIDAKNIFTGADQVSANNKKYIEIAGANHFTSVRERNGEFWQLLDQLLLSVGY